MDIDVFWLVASLGGGAFAAAIGGQTSFIFTGFAFLFGLSGLLGDGSAGFIEFVAFGPVFGPHIAFAGAVAAAAYAGQRGYMESRKDIITPLATLSRPDVLVVGAVFGAIGYLVEQLVRLIPWFGSTTDTVATTVVIMGFLARWIFGRQSGFGPYTKGVPVLSTKDDTHWVPWQEGWGITSAHGFFSGLVFGAAALVLVNNFSEDVAGWAFLIGWAFSAVSLTFLSLGMKTPVTHHMTLVGALAAVQFFPIVGDNFAVATLIGGVFGLIAGVLGEVFARLTQNRGNTHIDPPAFAIFPGTTLVLVLAQALS